jgi:transcriptional accessory protein Tex/SPT6
MSQQFISNPNQVVHLNQNVTVWVKEIDQSRNRVQLTMVASNVL